MKGRFGSILDHVAESSRVADPTLSSTLIHPSVTDQAMDKELNDNLEVCFI